MLGLVLLFLLGLSLRNRVRMKFWKTARVNCAIPCGLPQPPYWFFEIYADAAAPRSLKDLTGRRRRRLLELLFMDGHLAKTAKAA